jgi:hypothetical protein
MKTNIAIVQQEISISETFLNEEHRDPPIYFLAPPRSRAEVSIRAFPAFPQDRRELQTASGTWVVGMVVEGLIWSFCPAFGRTPPVDCVEWIAMERFMLALVAVAVVVTRSGAKSPGTFAVGRRPRPSGRRYSGRG